MKKIYLIVTLSFAVILLQNCKKDTITASTNNNTTNVFFAVINDTTWVSDTINASITYNSATKNKIFSCSAIALNKEINMSVAINAALNTAGFPLFTYNVSTTPNVLMSYYTTQKNANGILVLAPLGTVAPGSGSVTITAIDSVKKVITGTFSCAAIKNNTDSNGNVISVTRANITSGAFNNLPYTFINN